MSHSSSVKWFLANFSFKIARPITNSIEPILAIYQYAPNQAAKQTAFTQPKVKTFRPFPGRQIPMSCK